MKIMKYRSSHTDGFPEIAILKYFKNVFIKIAQRFPIRIFFGNFEIIFSAATLHKS